MYFAINGEELPIYPSEFSVSVMDLDDAETTTRTADGTLSRDRITVKRQMEISWPPMTWDKLSAILQAMGDEFFEFTYPDSMSGQIETRIVYAGNRKAPVLFTRNGVTLWQGLQVTLTEQ